MIARVLAASLFALTLAGQSAPPAGPEIGVTLPEGNLDYDGSYARQIFFAVLEGLYADGVQTEVVDQIVAIDEQTHWPAYFVYACPICVPAYNAFAVYQKRATFPFLKGEPNTFGPGLPDEMVKRLSAGDAIARKAAIQELVQGWIRRRMEALRLTEEEREEWTLEMAKRRKQGMAFLDQYLRQGVGGAWASGKASCPLCEAANGACARR